MANTNTAGQTWHLINYATLAVTEYPSREAAIAAWRAADDADVVSDYGTIEERCHTIAMVR